MIGYKVFKVLKQQQQTLQILNIKGSVLVQLIGEGTCFAFWGRSKGCEIYYNKHALLFSVDGRKWLNIPTC